MPPVTAPGPVSDIPSSPQALAAAPKPHWGTLALNSFADPERAAFIRAVYAWMFAGLVISAGIAYWVSLTPAVAQLVIGNEVVFFALLGAELVAVIILASVVHKISSVASSLIFLLYSALNGLTLSVVFFAFQFNSIVEVFLITAAMFGALSLYGYLTKRDLTGIGQFAVMALFGLVIAMLVNLFVDSSTADLILACAGVVIFTVLTAYDTQKLKWLYELGRTEGSDGEKKEAINGALTLYLDFINLFLDLLRIFGKRR